jgi:hypothetical protein
MVSATLPVRGVRRPMLPRPRFAGAWRYETLSLAFLVAAAGVGGVSVLRPRLSLVLIIVLAVFAVVSARPALGGYLLIGLTPITAGIDRGSAVPVLRPSEALALAIGLALATGALLRRRTGEAEPLRLTPIETAILLMALANSVVPMIWMLARGQTITRDDLLYALVLWKFGGIYLIVRASVTTIPQVMRCLWISVSVGAFVALTAILQSLGLFGVPRLLATYYAPYGYTGALEHARGSSTLALPAATADLCIYNLAVVAGLWVQFPRYRPLLGGIATTLVFGALAAGEFSSAIGLIIGICAIALVTSYPRLLSIFIPITGLAVIFLRPVIAARLQGFQSLSGLPVSWTGRLHNLQSYFWPELLRDWNYLLGVRPAARVPVAYQATGYVWIESGYTWLLWGGGIPLFAAFVYFCSTTLRSAWAQTRSPEPPINAAALGVFVSVVVMIVLMIFDPHLTYRGAAEEMFALLALARAHELYRSARSTDQSEGGRFATEVAR